MSRLRLMMMTTLLVIRCTATHSQQQYRLWPLRSRDGVRPSMITVIYSVSVPLVTLRELFATETNCNDIGLTTFWAASRRLRGADEYEIAFERGH